MSGIVVCYDNIAVKKTYKYIFSGSLYSHWIVGRKNNKQRM